MPCIRLLRHPQQPLFAMLLLPLPRLPVRGLRRQFSDSYVSAEEKAHALKKGIWQGEFQEPAQWRRERRHAGTGGGKGHSGGGGGGSSGRRTHTKGGQARRHGKSDAQIGYVK